MAAKIQWLELPSGGRPVTRSRDVDISVPGFGSHLGADFRAAPSERCSAYGEAVPEAVRCAASGRSLVSRYFRGAQVFTVLPLNWVQISVFLGYFAPVWEPSLPQPAWASHLPRIL